MRNIRSSRSKRYKHPLPHSCFEFFSFIYLHVHTYIHTYIHTYKHSYIQTYARLHVYTSTHLHIYTSTHPHIHTPIHPHIHSLFQSNQSNSLTLQLFPQLHSFFFLQQKKSTQHAKNILLGQCRHVRHQQLSSLHGSYADYPRRPPIQPAEEEAESSPPLEQSPTGARVLRARPAVQAKEAQLGAKADITKARREPSAKAD